MPTTMSWIAVNDGSGITIKPLYFGSVRSDQVFGRSFSATLSVRTTMPNEMDALRDPVALRVLGAVDHLVEAFRPERRRTSPAG